MNDAGAGVARQVTRLAAERSDVLVSGGAKGVDQVAMSAAEEAGGAVVAGFSVGNAMARNKIVYALARVTLVVAADAHLGGTWEGAQEALRRAFGPVTVWIGEGRRGSGRGWVPQRLARGRAGVLAPYAAANGGPALASILTGNCPR
ncbi:MAG: hypothetical protein WD250_06800 [Egibacteraceae bacterium]